MREKHSLKSSKIEAKTVLAMGEKSGQVPYDHELSLSELFNQTFTIARKNYLRVLPVFVVFGIVSTIFSTYMSYATPSLATPSNLQNLTSTELFALANSAGQLIGYTLANYFVSWCILYFAAGIGLRQMGKALGLAGDSTQSDKLNYGALALTTLLAVVIIEAGLFLIIIGALIFGTMFYLSLAASTLEGKSPTASLGRSRQLVSGRWFRTFVLLAAVQIFIVLVASVVSGVVGLPFPSGAEGTLAALLAQNFVTALGFPLVSSSMLVLYMSSKARTVQVSTKPPSPYDYMKPEPVGAFAKQPGRFCTQCGASVTQEEKFCHNCGAVQSA
ncbi:MAG: zinc ribbon domain-containing protein [Thaumarchaeota archaeon]|nr:zinc ribbon domain-containing protein [Nitrososphaerota archaeon]